MKRKWSWTAFVILLLIPLILGLAKVVVYKEYLEFLSNAIGELPIVGAFISSMVNITQRTLTETSVIRDMEQILYVMELESLKAGLIATTIFAISEIVGFLCSGLLRSVISTFVGVAAGMLLLILINPANLEAALIPVAAMGLIDMVLIVVKNGLSIRLIRPLFRMGFQMFVAGVASFVCSTVAVYFSQSADQSFPTYLSLVVLPYLYFVAVIFVNLGLELWDKADE